MPNNSDPWASILNSGAGTQDLAQQAAAETLNVYSPAYYAAQHAPAIGATVFGGAAAANGLVKNFATRAAISEGIDLSNRTTANARTWQDNLNQARYHAQGAAQPPGLLGSTPIDTIQANVVPATVRLKDHVTQQILANSKASQELAQFQADKTVNNELRALLAKDSGNPARQWWNKTHVLDDALSAREIDRLMAKPNRPGRNYVRNAGPPQTGPGLAAVGPRDVLSTIDAFANPLIHGGAKINDFVPSQTMGQRVARWGSQDVPGLGNVPGFGGTGLPRQQQPPLPADAGTLARLRRGTPFRSGVTRSLLAAGAGYGLGSVIQPTEAVSKAIKGNNSVLQ